MPMNRIFRRAAPAECKELTLLPSQDEGRQAQAAWDATTAENLDNISPDQEWEIRDTIGAGLPIASSEVDD